MKAFLAVFFLLGSLLHVCIAEGDDRKAETVQNPQLLTLPGHPFGVVASPDGASVFVAITAAPAGATGVAVIQKDHGKYSLKRVVPLDEPTGLALTHDGKVLIAAAGDSVFVLDTSRMISGTGDPLISTFSDGENAGSIYANVTRDDKSLFISNERAESITVINLERVRSNGYDARSVVGKIPAGEAPIALTFSSDGRFLFTTSEGALPSWGWPNTVKPEDAGSNADNRMFPQGAVVVVDVSKAITDPAHSVVARIPAGSSPVRMTISPDGKRVYVTARGDNAVLVFDAGKLVTDPEHSRLATVPVGPAPVPLAIIQKGRILVVGNSNRFGTDANSLQNLSVLDTSKIGHGNPLIGVISAGAFPREMCVSSDNETLFLTNFLSDSMEVIDARNLPMSPDQNRTTSALQSQPLSRANQLVGGEEGSRALLILSINNEKQLGMACTQYAVDNDDKLPPSLDALFPTYLTDRRVLVSPLKPAEPIGYTYTPSLKNADPATTVIIEDKFAPALRHVRIVTYGDGNTRIVNIP